MPASSGQAILFIKKAFGIETWQIFDPPTRESGPFSLPCIAEGNSQQVKAILGLDQRTRIRTMMEMTTRARRGNGSPVRVLVVDDEAAIREVVRIRLKKCSY